MDTLLTEIALEGFKSFRDKTVLKFDGPFTAVVGPNGSGKSNVVDAIKWVLGDQSPRSIRASSGLEAIYQPVEGNGKDAVGFASVCIKINNSISPVDDEPGMWEIERRYYRSGESVYSINGKTTRLKDIRALMAQKGFGLGSLSVVGQGEIDGFLSLVPADRRLVFEDLARISDFKANKRKILGQLDECARNHQRLVDLIGEIAVRVDKLSVQATAARQHAELTDSRTEVEAQLAAQEYLLSFRNVERNETRLEEINDELKNTRNLRNNIVTDLGNAKTGLEKARNDNATILAECEQGRRELGHATAEERRLRDASSHLATFIGTLEEELSERKQRLDKFLARKIELDEISKNALTAQRESERRRLDMDSYLSRRWGYMQSCRRERERLASRVERLQGEGSFFARDAEFHNRRAEALQSDVEELTGQCASIKEKIENINSILAQLSIDQENLESSKLTTEESLSEIGRKVQSLKEELSLAEDTNREILTRIAAYESEKKLLLELEKDREGYGEGVKAILDRRDEFHGLKGTLGENIKVETGYEEIIERVLGDSIEFLICETLEQAIELVDVVKKDQLGRITCIILELVPDPSQGSADDDLLTHCTIKTELEPVLTLFLAGARLSEGISQLKGPDLSKVLISSGGVVFRPPAFISGGSESSPAKGILTRRARIDEIEQLMKDCRSDAEDQTVTIGQIVDQVSDLERARDESIAELDGIRDQIRLNETSRDQNSDRHEKAIEDLKGLEDRVDEINSEREGCLENALLASQGIEAVKRARLDSENELVQIENELPGLNNQVEDLRSRVQRAIVEVASFEEEARRAVKESSNLDEEIGLIRNEHDDRRKRLDGIREDARGTSEELDQAIELRKKLEEKIPELEEKEKEASLLIGTVAEKVKEMEIEVENARERVSDMEDSLHAQEVRLAELRGGLTSLEKELDEFPEFAERIKSGEMKGKDIPSKKELNEKLEQTILDLEEIGDVNPLAIEEEKLARERMVELKNEREDLLLAEEDLRKALEEVERESVKAFIATFDEARDRFAEVFSSLFPGGSGELKLTEPENPLESGIDVRVQFPGKGELDLLQLSGGERSLIALALLFAILKVKPSSFTLLDEVEAALDDVNTQKFLDYLGREFEDRQFILITHNKITMERADRLYGVTMDNTGISQVVSVDLKKLKEEGVDQVLGTAN